MAAPLAVAGAVELRSMHLSSRSKIFLHTRQERALPTSGQTIPATARLGLARGTHLEPASDEHSRVPQPPPARPSPASISFRCLLAAAAGSPPAPISRDACRNHHPARGLREAPCGESRFESGGWAAATVAAVALVAAVAALPTPRPPLSRLGAAPARARTHPFLTGTGVQVDRAGGWAAGTLRGAAWGVRSSACAP